MTLRYFDPSYQIRGQPANTEDALLCDRWAATRCTRRWPARPAW